MTDQRAFILPISGLGAGLHEYDLILDADFLRQFPDGPFADCRVDLHLNVDKQPREITLDFALKGTVATDCDRCLAPIDLPVEDRRPLILQFSATAEGQTDEGDIVYLHPDTPELDLAPFAYEMLVLAIPMIRTFACREGQPPYPCDEEMLDRIERSSAPDTSSPAAPPKEEGGGSPWDVLKDLNN